MEKVKPKSNTRSVNTTNFDIRPAVGYETAGQG